jgi:hypothetical protein
MPLLFSRINYEDLNARQKENYNFQKVSGVLAEYGFVTLRLTDDWKGADFIAQNIDGETLLKVQLKARLTLDKKYIGKSLHITFPEGEEWYLYPHDEVLDRISDLSGLKNSAAWERSGLRHYSKIPNRYRELLLEYRIYPY